MPNLTSLEVIGVPSSNFRPSLSVEVGHDRVRVVGVAACGRRQCPVDEAIEVADSRVEAAGRVEVGEVGILEDVDDAPGGGGVTLPRRVGVVGRAGASGQDEGGRRSADQCGEEKFLHGSLVRGVG